METDHETEKQATDRMTAAVREAVALNSSFLRDVISAPAPSEFIIMEPDGREFVVTVRQSMPPEDER